MSITQEDIQGVTEAVWAAMFGASLVRLDPEPSALSEIVVSGRVVISGHRTFAIVVHTTAETALRAAEAMFDTPIDRVTVEELRDAIGELANVVGGNLKALLPGPSALSTPTTVVPARLVADIREGRLVESARFDWGGGVVTVDVLCDEDDRSGASVKGIEQ